MACKLAPTIDNESQNFTNKSKMGTSYAQKYRAARDRRVYVQVPHDASGGGIKMSQRPET